MGSDGIARLGHTYRRAGRAAATSAARVNSPAASKRRACAFCPDGNLSQASHPVALGSALTHPLITTDFCESQPELITGVHTTCKAASTSSATSTASSIARSTTSCCGLPACRACSDRTIRCPIAHLRRSRTSAAPSTSIACGLGARYGRLMQTISGIHYNFSIPDALWSVIAQIQGTQDSRAFRDDGLFRPDPQLPPSLVAADLLVRRIAGIVQVVRQRQDRTASRVSTKGRCSLPYAHVAADGRVSVTQRRTVEPAHLVQLAARSTRIRCSMR